MRGRQREETETERMRGERHGERGGREEKTETERERRRQRDAV